VQNKTLPLFAFAAKFGPKLLSLIVKLGKFAKLGLAGASLAGYAMLFTWQFAVVILAAIGFHESGHVWAMRRCGIKTKGFYFIPFFGGAAVAEESFKTRANEAFIGIMGPVWGFALALAAYGIYLLTHNPLFAAITAWMALINLINLLPINPLDGGRITKSIVFSISSGLGLVFLIIGTIAMVYFSIQFHFFLFLILMGAGVVELLDEQKDYLLNRVKAKFFPPEELHGTYKPAMTVAQRFLTFFSYTGLISAFIYLMYLTSHVPGSAAAMETLIDSHPSTSTSTTHSIAWWVIILLVLLAAGVLFILYAMVRKFIDSIKEAKQLEQALSQTKELTEDIPTMIRSVRQPYDNPDSPDYEETMARRFVLKYILEQSQSWASADILHDYIAYRMKNYQGSFKIVTEPQPA